jgi:LacI family transcriptional regulator, galactose operon repressor
VPTITTVARLANVSVASASRVMNGIRTSPATLERVTEAAEAIGYVPNAAARTLRSRRTGQIAFAMPDVGNPVYTTMIGSIQDVAQARGWRLMLHSTGADMEDELAMVRDLKHRFVDGLILASLHLTDVHADELRRAAAPVILIGRPATGTTVDTVRAYSRKGASEAVRHLYAANRSRIGFVNGPQHTAPGSSRRLGYLDGLRSCSLIRDDGLIEVAADFMIEPGRRATERLLARERPDAILCANDLLAIGALAALRDAGLDVPGDVAIVGMDNTPLSEVTWPTLTTVDLGSSERARIAAEMLLERIEDPMREPRVVGVEPRLVVRASSGVQAEAQA